MKIKGQTAFSLESEEFLLIPPREDGSSEGLTVTIRPIKTTFLETLQRRLPTPVPPQEFVPKPGGGYVIDPRTKRPMVGPNENDPSYQAETFSHNILKLVATFYEGTRACEDIQFDALEPTSERPDDWEKFYQSVRAEIENAGLHFGRLNACAGAILKMSGMNTERLEEDAHAFS